MEHCSAAVILQAMHGAQWGQPNRREFSREDLIEWQLVTPMGAPTQVPPSHTPMMAVRTLLAVAHSEATSQTIAD